MLTSVAVLRRTVTHANAFLYQQLLQTKTAIAFSTATPAIGRRRCQIPSSAVATISRRLRRLASTGCYTPFSGGIDACIKVTRGFNISVFPDLIAGISRIVRAEVTSNEVLLFIRSIQVQVLSNCTTYSSGSIFRLYFNFHETLFRAGLPKF